MPDKVNPVIPEAVAMVCAQVIGNDLTVTVAGQSGNFQINVMLPVIGHNLLQSIGLLANAAGLLADKAIRDFRVNEARLASLSERSPILATALTTLIGYDKAAQIGARARTEQRVLKDVAKAMTDLPSDELERLLDPRRMTKGGFPDKSF